ncbi:hypothetical protein FBALC1_10832 [Flavobacteriales bacterium ALC-1]|nr:hypothetical protein FBALC1_10832 [Flavobacteriales bacterium ALC-1]
MKKLTLLIFLVLSIFSCKSQKEIDLKSTTFIWFNDTLNGVAFEKTSMHIPVKFKNDSTTYYFQFDTGSNKSYLYTGVKSNLKIIKKIKTETELHTSIGNITLLSRKSNSAYRKDGKKFIGTIGSDVLFNKIIEIDFSNQKINVLNKYKKENYNLDLMKLSYGRPAINLKIMNKKYQFLYDTGSSLFDLWTDKKHWEKWKKNDSDISEFPISSWGKINTAYKSKINDSIIAENHLNIDLKYIWYNSNQNFKKGFKKAKVSGLIGNRPFLQHVLLLDFKNNLIGIKKTNINMLN